LQLSICYVTAEMAPYAKAGGLADVSAALPRLLHARGHTLHCFLPRYADLELHGLAIEPIDRLAGLQVDLGPRRFEYSVLRGRRPAGGPDLLLVDCPALFARPGLYGSAADEHLRFLLLSRAALECCQRLGVVPDVVHCHDWHTALLPLYLRTLYAADPAFTRTRSVLTIHNLGYQGILPAATVGDLGLGEAVSMLDRRDAAEGRINLLREGIIHADAVSTVSPGYAREICTPELGMGLDDSLRARGDEIVGILNGVDDEEWDPAADRHIPHRYSTADLAGKTRMRSALCRRMGLEDDPGRPLVGMVSRLVWQKGVDLLFDVVPELVRERRLSLVVLGGGDPAYERFFKRLAGSHPGLAAYQPGHDEELAHWIEAGCDAFLMPSRYEPCGLNQMYSLRYGTVPVVRRTGGLADTVQPVDPTAGTGTGIVFENADTGGVRWALEELCRLFADRTAWSRVVAAGMAQDFGWQVAAGRYLELYARAVATQR
jgi:starch synthase